MYIFIGLLVSIICVLPTVAFIRDVSKSAKTDNDLTRIRTIKQVELLKDFLNEK